MLVQGPGLSRVSRVVDSDTRDSVIDHFISKTVEYTEAIATRLKRRKLRLRGQEMPNLIENTDTNDTQNETIQNFKQFKGTKISSLIGSRPINLSISQII